MRRNKEKQRSGKKSCKEMKKCLVFSFFSFFHSSVTPLLQVLEFTLFFFFLLLQVFTSRTLNWPKLKQELKPRGEIRRTKSNQFRSFFWFISEGFVKNCRSGADDIRVYMIRTSPSKDSADYLSLINTSSKFPAPIVIIGLIEQIYDDKQTYPVNINHATIYTRGHDK